MTREKRLNLVSIIIPCYRQAQYLRDAVDSALAQTYPNVEVIVVNDGSDDNTEEIAKTYGSRIRYLRQKNRGLSAARNAGFAASTGAIIQFLDADDVLLPSMVGRLWDLLEQRPAYGVAYCGCMVTGENLEETTWLHFNPGSGDACSDLCVCNLFPVHAALTRCSVLHEVGGFDESLESCEDWDLWNRLAMWGVKFIGWNETLVKYRQQGAAMSRKAETMYDAGSRVFERHTPSTLQPRALAYWTGTCCGIALAGNDAYVARMLVARLPCERLSDNDMEQFGARLLTALAQRRGVLLSHAECWNAMVSTLIPFLAELPPTQNVLRLIAHALRGIFRGELGLVERPALERKIASLNATVDVYRRSRVLRYYHVARRLLTGGWN